MKRVIALLTACLSLSVLAQTKIDLSKQVKGNLPVANLNNGTNASASTFWRGDGTWVAAGGGGTPGGTNGQIQYNNAGAFGGLDPVTLVGTPSSGSVTYWTSATTQALLNGTGLMLLQGASAPLAYTGSSVSGVMPTALSASGVMTGTATPTLGASGVLGSVTMGNATSGTLKIQPVTGALGTTTLLIPVAAGVGTIAQRIASGSAVVNPGALTSGSCSSAIDGGTATGVLTTDIVNYAFNADPSAATGYSGIGSLVTIYKYPTADHVNFKVCNWTGSSITPASVTINWSVVR